MSTKIYNAYRVKPGNRIEDLIVSWQKRGRKNAEKVMSDFIISLAGITDVRSAVYKRALKLAEKQKYDNNTAIQFAKLRVSIELVQLKYYEQLKKSVRNPFNFDVTISFRFYKRRVYIQTYCDWTMGSVLDFIKKDRRLEDFHYQNSTDKPNHISEKNWRKREHIWDEIYLDDGRLRSLNLNIVSRTGFWSLMYDIELNLIEKIKKGLVKL